MWEYSNMGFQDMSKEILDTQVSVSGKADFDKEKDKDIVMEIQICWKKF